jgi:hypothetical protein
VAAGVRQVASYGIFTYTCLKVWRPGSADPGRLQLYFAAAFNGEQGISMKSIHCASSCVPALAPARTPSTGSAHVKRLGAAASLALALLILSAPDAFAQKLYKHVDENGVVTYTDRPEEATQKRMKVDNVQRNGDRNDSINANLERQKLVSDRNWQIKQYEWEYQQARKEAANKPKTQTDLQRIPGPVYQQTQATPPSPRDNTRQAE